MKSASLSTGQSIGIYRHGSIGSQATVAVADPGASSTAAAGCDGGRPGVDDELR